MQNTCTAVVYAIVFGTCFCQSKRSQLQLEIVHSKIFIRPTHDNSEKIALQLNVTLFIVYRKKEYHLLLIFFIVDSDCFISLLSNSIMHTCMPA